MTLSGPCRVILIGMMGSGKTAVGRLLAERTGWPYHDNDDLLLHLSGRTPRQILASRGEASLREAESRALAAAVALPPPCVIGVPAGTILEPWNRRVMSEAGVVVWLRASAQAVERRASGAPHRAWLDRPGWISAAVAERDPLYSSVADAVVDTDASGAAEVAQAVLDRIGALEVCARWVPVADQG